jgi:hypothetical protein
MSSRKSPQLTPELLAALPTAGFVLYEKEKKGCCPSLFSVDGCRLFR